MSANHEPQISRPTLYPGRPDLSAFSRRRYVGAGLVAALKSFSLADIQKFSMSKRQTIIVSDRGQITLPQEIRKKLGIKAGTALVAEEEEGKVVLRPAAVTPVEIYSDEEIQDWLVEDRISERERRKILKKVGRR